MTNWIGIVLMGAAALVSWRLSRTISVALWASFAGSCFYELSAQYFEDAWKRGDFEHIRLVSLLVGSAGIFELTRRVRGHVAIKARVGRWAFSSLDLLAIVCFASSCVDGAAMLFHRARWVWAFPPVQIAETLLMIGICLRERGKP